MPLNDQFILMNRKEPYLLISTGLTNKFNTFEYKITNEFSKYDSDYRMLDIPDEIDNNKGYILLTYVFEKYYICCVYSGIRKILYDLKSQEFTVTNPVRLYYNESREKNWTPFQYNNDIYFIQRLNPLHVLQITNTPMFKTRFVYKTVDSYEMITVSKSNCSNIPWNYGELRGGTQAIYINNYGYLSFFHSFVEVCTHRRFYFFGAYIFSIHPPFKLLKISNQPIVSEEFFESLTRGHDHHSILFPMSYYIEDINGNAIRGSKITNKPHKIVLSAGYNDTDGLVVKLNFDNLVSSLIDLDC